MAEDMIEVLALFSSKLDRIEASAVFWKEAEDDMPVRGTEAVTLGELRRARAVLRNHIAQGETG